jgi:hypothetical protein
MARRSNMGVCCLIHHDVLFLYSDECWDIEYGGIPVWTVVTELAEL